ncbi:hypothetical protein HOF92_14745, partial [bacterium]|nr:hypothetical protein [bacterium]
MMLEVARRSFSRLLKPMMIYLGIALFASSISLNHPTLLMAPTITVLIIALGLLAACVLFCDSESQDRFRYHNLLPLPEFSYFAGRVAGGLLGLGFGFWVFWIFLLFHESRGSVGEIGFLHLVPLVLQGICYGTSLYLVRISLFAKRGRGGSLKTSLKGSRIWLYLAAGFFISAIISESLINPKHLIIHPYYRYTLFPDVFSHQVDILLIFHISVFAFSLSIFVMAFAKQFLEGFLLCIFSFLAISYLVLGWLPWVLSLKPVYLLTSTTIFLFWIGWRVHNISEIAPSPQLRQGWLWRAFLKFFSVMLIWFLISIARVGLMDQPQEILGVDLNPNSGLLMVLSEHNHWSLKWLLVEEEILQSIQVFSPEGKSLSKLPDVIKLQQPTTDYFLEVEPVKPFYASSVKLSVYKGNGTKALKKKTMEFDHLLLPNRGYPNWNQPQLKKATIIDGIDPDTGSVYYHERREYYLGTTYYKMSIGSAMPERLKGIHPWGSSFPEGRLEVIPEKPFNNETFPRIRAQNRLFNLKASHKQYLDEKQDKNSLKTRDLEWLGR